MLGCTLAKYFLAVGQSIIHSTIHQFSFIFGLRYLTSTTAISNGSRFKIESLVASAYLKRIVRTKGWERGYVNQIGKTCMQYVVQVDVELSLKRTSRILRNFSSIHNSINETSVDSTHLNWHFISFFLAPHAHSSLLSLILPLARFFMVAGSCHWSCILVVDGWMHATHRKLWLQLVHRYYIIA